MTVLTGRESCSFFDFVRSVTPFPLLLGCTPMIRSFASPLNLAVCLLVRFKGSREKIFSFGRLTMNEELSRIQSHKRSFEKFAGVATMIDMCWRRGGDGWSYESSEYGMPVQCPSTEKWEECWEERDSGVFVVQSSLPGVRATQLNARLKLSSAQAPHLRSRRAAGPRERDRQETSELRDAITCSLHPAS